MSTSLFEFARTPINCCRSGPESAMNHSLTRSIVSSRRREERACCERRSEAYAAIADDPEEDAAWRAEIATWDVTVGDGLESEPEYKDEP